MRARDMFLTISMVAVLVAAPWCETLAGMSSPNSASRPVGADTMITDAAGRVHKVMPMRSLTAEQRKAAAKRARATRNLKAGQVEGGGMSRTGGAE